MFKALCYWLGEDILIYMHFNIIHTAHLLNLLLTARCTFTEIRDVSASTIPTVFCFKLLTFSAFCYLPKLTKHCAVCGLLIHGFVLFVCFPRILKFNTLKYFC